MSLCVKLLGLLEVLAIRAHLRLLDLLGDEVSIVKAASWVMFLARMLLNDPMIAVEIGNIAHTCRLAKLVKFRMDWRREDSAERGLLLLLVNKL